MKKQNKSLPIVILAGILLVSTVLWFTGAYDALFSGTVPDQVGNTLALDLETLQITIKTVSSPLIEELQFVEAIDTLNAHESIKKLRNPFVRVKVAPPSSAKAKVTSKSKSTKKPVKQKKRIRRPKIIINGIIWDRSNPFAILNNDIYGEGDKIKGYTIQTIQDTMIVLANNEDVYSIVIERE